MITTSQLMPTFNRVLAFDRELDRLVNWNGQRAFVPSLDVVERADAYLISAELPGVDPSAVEKHAHASRDEDSVAAAAGERGAPGVYGGASQRPVRARGSAARVCRG